ncbi:MAG TPA: phosphatase [Actinomycetota bacterium]|nr:phosphatase [Actinomycetota bacterium]
MDVIEAHARRLPALDERWEPRAHPRAELERALVVGGVAGPAGHPHDNVFGNIRKLVEHDPDKLFGLSSMPEPFGFEEIVRIVGDAAGVPIDHLATDGAPDIAAGAVIDACGAMGERLSEAARRGQRILFATGHPADLDPFYSSIARLAEGHGATKIRPADGRSWFDDHVDHDWTVAFHGPVGMVTDGVRPRHTHRPEAMRRMLAEERPDLVVADHGMAGAAIEAGVETLSVADVNDPALIVARAQGRTDVVDVLDDHVPAENYWPCFQAVAEAF